jgi:hypothetical protein
MVVAVVWSVVVAATEAASVVKVAVVEEMTAAEGEVEANGGGGGPLAAPNTHCCFSGGVLPHNLHAIGGVKKHRCLSRRNHRQSLFGWRAIARHPILSGLAGGGGPSSRAHTKVRGHGAQHTAWCGIDGGSSH